MKQIYLGFTNYVRLRRMDKFSKLNIPFYYLLGMYLRVEFSKSVKSKMVDFFGIFQAFLAKILSKVQLFSENHKILPNLPHGVDIYLVNFCGLLRKTEL